MTDKNIILTPYPKNKTEFQTTNSALFKSTTVSAVPFLIIAVLLSLVAAIGLNLTTGLITIVLMASPFAILMAFIIFQKPEFGAYILLITIFTNVSDLLTEKGYPGVNKPLVALVFLSIFLNIIYQYRYNSRVLKITRIELLLLLYYLVVVSSSFFMTEDKSSSIDIIINISKDILVGICIFLALSTKEKWINGIWVLITVVSLISFLGTIKMLTGIEQTFGGLAQLSSLGQVTDFGELRYGGPIGEPNIWGQVLVTVLPLVIYRFVSEKFPMRKTILFLCITFIFISIIYTQSRGAFLALLVVFVLIALQLRIKISTLTIVSAITLLGVALLPARYVERYISLQLLFPTGQQASLSQDESFAGRREKMLTGLAMFRDNPTIGVGFGNYSDRYWEYAGKLGLEAGDINLDTDRQPHSLYIEIMSETGLLGLLTFLTFFGLLLSKLYKTQDALTQTESNRDWEQWKKALAISIIAFLFSGFFLHGILFRYIWVLIGLSLAAIQLSFNDLQASIANR